MKQNNCRHKFKRICNTTNLYKCELCGLIILKMNDKLIALKYDLEESDNEK